MGSEARRRSRERLRQQREKDQRAAARKRGLTVALIAVGVVALVVGVGYVILNLDSSGADYDGGLAPQTLQADGSVVMAEPGAQAPVVEVYADYQCPACRQFELLNGDLLQEKAALGEAIVQFRPVSIFARQPEPISGNSLRAGAAARAAADHGVFVQYNDLLFENQPTEGSEGFTPQQLKELFAETDAPEGAAAGFDERVDAEAETVDRFTGEFLPALTADAVEEFGQDEVAAMPLTDLLDWGADNGHDPSFLEGTYTGETIEATGNAYTRYSGENAFRATPSVYINGELLDNTTTMTVRGLRGAIDDAAPGEVETEPLTDGGGTD
ncbi:thioredoxin domain-containing protein [Nocardiopsis sp. CNT312]|uniref:DsbA family protein n=1 Tax=Nocardiopsis sp. CNT312 TaxID=1137268 RepID=UPI00048DAA5D|nr:thioredoxin domain-containing protein [Nocardiopsis sp. CNT312]